MFRIKGKLNIIAFVPTLNNVQEYPNKLNNFNSSGGTSCYTVSKCQFAVF